ncbi:MAG: hypothetical protein M0C28_05340 [Candidatus Moduliflexus flocculans]|nr:hypothetical protein [Candidatus Moduliflexus flocculans]
MTRSTLSLVAASFRRFNGDKCWTSAIVISYFALLCSVPLIALFFSRRGPLPGRHGDGPAEPQHLHRRVLRPARPGLLQGPGRPVERGRRPGPVRRRRLARLGQLPLLDPHHDDQPDLPDEVPPLLRLQPAHRVPADVRRRRSSCSSRWP